MNMAKRKPSLSPYLCTMTGSTIYHIRNPQTDRSYCQCENNASWSLLSMKKISAGRRPCKQCADLEKRGKTTPNPPLPMSPEKAAAIVAEDWDRELYGADYEHLKSSGWIDR